MPRVRSIMKILEHINSLTSNYFTQICNPLLRNAFAVASHLTIQERVILFKISLQSKVIVEIGSYIGASACCFGAAVMTSGSGKIICIDTWYNDAMSEGNRDTWKEFQENTREYKDFIFSIRGFSTDVIQSVRDVTSDLDVLFIDGDHSYEGVKADWEAYKSFLKNGSVVIFHDYGWAEGVKRVVHEDVMPLVCSHDHLPNMWWGQIGSVS
jgi:predicted O-methyltransferase YrrM